MDEARAKKRARLISIWFLLWSIIAVVFYLSVQFSIIEEELSLYEHIDFYVQLILGLIIFYGLLTIKSWSWKLAVVVIPLKWLFSIIYISQDYQQNIGFLYALYIVIDVIILKLLFMPDMKKLFGIQNWSGVKWVIVPLLLSAAFFLGYEILAF